ncbi:MAG: sigma-54-dependent Fis family transcriptional regulator [Acidobacteria bacterium]|nr:sigma-54-dependent Fis family transcriptional regulator [Acidobacteriota bacterium]
MVKHLPRGKVGNSRIITHDPELEAILHEAAKVARSDASIMITGETGTGKDLLANEIHSSSHRSSKPFVTINCATLSEQLLESELFGHVRGAFTGADRSKVGFFEAANGGTVFLDEIGEVSPSFQVKLLRVLQYGEFNRVGDIKTYHSNVRIVAATNQDLERRVKDGGFRNDLYYRLNVVSFRLPPLRERRCDIAPLAAHFVQLMSRECSREIREISKETLEALLMYDWPGNVRELRNVMERAVILCDGLALGPETIPKKLRSFVRLREESGNAAFDVADLNVPFKDAKERVLGQFESAYIHHHLLLSEGNVSQAARSTGIYAANLYEKIRRYGIDPDKYRQRTRTLAAATMRVPASRPSAIRRGLSEDCVAPAVEEAV